MSKEIQEFPLWAKLVGKDKPISFDLEITARCNNNCQHCYINLPAGDSRGQTDELTAKEILEIAGQAADLGALWCLVTGGEPLLRDDFAEIYLGLKRLGLLVGVFTNACLVTDSVVDLFKAYPPRDIEVTVYGATERTYETVTRSKGSWRAFQKGFNLLVEAGLPVRLKAVALRANLAEFEAISSFCRKHTKDYFRFDPLLHLRLDGDEERNAEIRAARLSPEEVVAVERADQERFGALVRDCEGGGLIHPEFELRDSKRLFHCGVGRGSFVVGYDGTFRLCSSLSHPGTTYDLKNGSLREAWENWVPYVRDMEIDSTRKSLKCGRCSITNLCLWCPANASLEAGALDEWVEYFCAIAHGRAKALGYQAEEAAEFDEDASL